jgi:uncharacterized membrane protein
MSTARGGWTDQQVENVLGNLLRAGVVTAALLVLAGGILYLVRFGAAVEDHHTFQSEPADLRSPQGIVQSALTLHSRGFIQLGLLLLIATPIFRVAASVYAFGRQRDVTYVLLTLLVLAILVASLFGEIAL